MVQPENWIWKWQTSVTFYPYSEFRLKYAVSVHRCCVALHRLESRFFNGKYVSLIITKALSTSTENTEI